ncbi:hypothetical protein NDU88_005425 [Pleurodeles waltl]|uniref:Uncharacterized protein n=1 Tax=Pleurodeles waltl TaxID=8319 RepID=A0AAV7WBE3_PLEWA|nr:hypothetical protein NDU88_005425 [Pleurodeles waltl]
MHVLCRGFGVLWQRVQRDLQRGSKARCGVGRECRCLVAPWASMSSVIDLRGRLLNRALGSTGLRGQRSKEAGAWATGFLWSGSAAGTRPLI